MTYDMFKVSKMTNYYDMFKVSKMTNYYDLFKVKIDSKDMDSYFKGLWWLTKRSMTLFKSQKSYKR